MNGLQINDRVVVEIRPNEVYEGNVESILSQSIELTNVYNQTKNIEIFCSLTFYRHEILGIHRITNSDKESEAVGRSDGIDRNPLTSTKKIKLHPDEFGRLKEMVVSFVFIDTRTKIYTDAIEVLNNRESVGVVGLGSTCNRQKKLDLLVLSDFKTVYIFDLFVLGGLYGLKDILESHFIVKVVYSGATLFDCLYHNHSTKMVNVFDIQITEQLLMKQETDAKTKSLEIANIAESLAYHFNFPTGLLLAAVEEGDQIWCERPITKGNKTKASQLCTYLLTLRDHLSHKIMKPYSNAVQVEYNRIKSMSDLQVLMLKTDVK